MRGGEVQYLYLVPFIRLFPKWVVISVALVCICKAIFYITLILRGAGWGRASENGQALPTLHSGPSSLLCTTAPEKWRGGGVKMSYTGLVSRSAVKV